MSNITESLNNLNLVDLKKLLRELKLYKDLKKQLWNRWKNIYKKLKTWDKSFLIEYFPSVSQELAWEKASKVYKNVFSLDVEKDNVVFLPKESIKWWIKVYVDDKIVDLSYERIERGIKS